MLNNFINCLLKTLLITFTLHSLHLVAGDLTVMEYGYGKREWIDNKYNSAEIHPLFTRYPPYSIFDIHQLRNDDQFNASIKVTVTTENNNVLALVNIKNSGLSSFYIRKIAFPIILSSATYDKNRNIASQLCSMSIFVTTGSTVLDYLGGRCNYGGNFEKEDWVEFTPGMTFTHTVILNDNFEFFPDRRYYNVGTSDYDMVNEKWFLDRSIYDHFFSILEINQYECHLTNDIQYIFLKEDICDVYYGARTNIKKLFYRLHFTGINEHNEFTLRSRQVNLEIDGSKIKSLYDNP